VSTFPENALARWARRLGVGVLVLIAVFVAAALVTARHGDPRFYPAAPGASTVPVFVVSHGYHAGIVLPRSRLAEFALRDRLGATAAVATRFSAFSALEIGWGDEGFYTSVPTIGALTVPIALRALFRPGNPTVLHVVGLTDHPAAAFPNSEVVQLSLSEAGFAALLGTLDATFTAGSGSPVQELGRGLYGPSLFYRANGTFHLFRVCNHWLADLLDAAGVPTAPMLATLPQGLILDLAWRSAAVRTVR
jgi:uncharacterized protein (TIGR02117 family)